MGDSLIAFHQHNCLHIGVAVQIHFVGQGNYILGTSDDTQLTSLAPLGIYHNGTFHFSHNILFNALNPEFGLQSYELVDK